MNTFAIAIHGGAGTVLKSLMTPELEILYKIGLEEAIGKGALVLRSGGTAIDAVEAAVHALEDNELFNAGKGAVFTHEGKHEMDACIMEGKDLRCGAVAGVSNIKNPIALARTVMEKSEHVLLAGLGAMEFAEAHKIPFAADDYFFSRERFLQLEEAKKSDSVVLDHFVPGHKRANKMGTVGAVALDVHGNLAAATSTGGMTNKRYGRIGDSPVAGAGTYANNKTCAVSCTGHGELFIRSVVAYDISCLMEYKGLSLKEACDRVVMDKLVKIGGEGGLIAVDTLGNIEMPFNSEGMYRAKQSGDSPSLVEIYR